MRFRQWLSKDTATALYFLAPSLIGFSIFYLIPFGMGVMYSFQDTNTDGSFAGFANYQQLFASASFNKAVNNTLLFTGISVPLVLIISLAIAILLNHNVYIRNWLRTAYVMPLVVPVASIILVWQVLFDWNGTINAILNSFGIDRIDWMKSEWARGVIIVVYIWKNIGYNIILFLAGLQNIPNDYYETADVEGAGPIRKFTNITLVYLLPTTIFVFLMSIVNSFKVFRETYLIAGNYPHDSLYMLQHYMNNMFLSLDIQKLTAAAVVTAGSILLLVSVLFAMERRFRNFMDG
ncbi:carbohydrate ABC transporter permease [Paenibacillus lutimineralis]|uniref:Sugar ABC transporter permease n=1 Tax=Paenibacillus lutimineralis TaxID=2707005 RepID=A0A3Q9ICR4_9BACL|nr:sugar ABC transporter permease [Paenibacillus lutimineralis]AZS16228.1 sugar ABC transporter permease [Paenibacillus lutimineralis]